MQKNAQITLPEHMGSIPARLIANGFNPAALRTNALLRKDEWELLDEAIVDVARQRLNGIADLRDRGLVLPLGGLGTIFSQYEQLQDMSGATVDMSGVAEGENDRVGFALQSVPVPIHHKDFTLNIRHLEASRRLGNALDVTQATVATRKVRDSLEDTLFNGVSIGSTDGNDIYGYTTHPSRVTGSATGDWGTIANIYTDVLAMIDDLNAINFFGPFGLYVGKAQFNETKAVYSDGSGQSAYSRVIENLGTAGSGDLEFFKPSDVLADGELVMVQLTRDVVDLAVAMDITAVEWDSLGGMVQHFKIMAAMVARIKATADGSLGVCHYSGA